MKNFLYPRRAVVFLLFHQADTILIDARVLLTGVSLAKDLITWGILDGALLLRE
jgi:hypothetical protein